MMEILDVTNTGRRRRFSVAEKIRIVEESLAGPNLTRATARRHGIAVSGLYQWRRLYHRGELGNSVPRFRPVDLLHELQAEAALAAPGGSEKVEIVLLNRRRLVVPATISSEALARFIAVAERA